MDKKTGKLSTKSASPRKGSKKLKNLPAAKAGAVRGGATLGVRKWSDIELKS